MTVKEAVEKLGEHDKMVEDFYNDPMMEAMGCPTGDFQEDFDKKERSLAFFILENTPKDSEDYKMAFGRLEKWMP
jgi:hypothetical protein